MSQALVTTERPLATTPTPSAHTPPAGGKTYPIMVTKEREAVLSVPARLTKKDLERIRAFLVFLEAGIDDDEPEAENEVE